MLLTSEPSLHTHAFFSLMLLGELELKLSWKNACLASKRLWVPSDAIFLQSFWGLRQGDEVFKVTFGS